MYGMGVGGVFSISERRPSSAMDGAVYATAALPRMWVMALVLLRL